MTLSWKSWTTAELAKLKKLYGLGVPMSVLERELQPRTRPAIRSALVRFGIERALYSSDKWMAIVHQHQPTIPYLGGEQ